MLYWYKSTNTDVLLGGQAREAQLRELLEHQDRYDQDVAQVVKAVVKAVVTAVVKLAEARQAQLRERVELLVHEPLSY